MEAFTYLKLQPCQLSHRHYYPQSISPLSSLKPNKSSTLFSQSQLKNSLKNPLTILKTPLTITITSTTLFFFGLSMHTPLPAIAKQQKPPPTVVEVESSSSENNVEALKSLMHTKIKSKKLHEAINVINKLIELEPNEFEWPLLKSQLYMDMREYEMAIASFEGVIAQDPTHIEALFGLVKTVSLMEGKEKDLEKVWGRVHKAIERSKEAKMEEQMRDCVLLYAQILAMRGEYMAALENFEELVKDKPQDFRPYLYKGIIYAMFKNGDEAEKQFEKFKSLLPKEHLYSVFFNENMFSTKVFYDMLVYENPLGV